MSKQQQITQTRTLMLGLAAAGVLGITTLASAQQRIDRSGANDANNRVGSNGRNDTFTPQLQPWQVNNAIVYGNVTGGKQFRGNLSSRDPREFRGETAGRNIDNFVRDSSGITTGGIEMFNANRTQAFYGQGRAVAPPPGFTGINSVGGYTAPAQTPWRNIDPRQQPVSAGAVTTLIRPDEFGAPGAMDTQYAPNALTVSPNTQAQAINPALLSDYTQLNRTSASPLDPMDISNLRQQLKDAPVGVDGQRRPGQPSSDAEETPRPGSMLDDSVRPSALQTGVDNTVQAGAISNDPAAGAAVEPGMRSRLPGAAEAASPYAGLAARRAEQEQVKRPGQANEEAARAFNEQLRAREKAAQDTAAKDQPRPGVERPQPDDNARPDNRRPVQPGAPDAPAQPGDQPPAAAPMKVDTLAGRSGTDVADDLLGKAEQQMREGKYASALESYDAAATLAPANRLVALGRAHAELGGGYYRRAEMSLRKTLQADKNLLAGQYNLKGFLGEQRIADIEKDLRELMQKNQDDVGAPLLLAYVYYNTGDERNAAAHLDLADKRAKGGDDFIKLLKENWSLPQGGAPVDNK